MKNALITCTACNDIFRTRHELNFHVRRDHQSSVKVKFRNGDVAEIIRAQDGTFKCRCGKGFKHPNSIRRHAKRCTYELAELEDDEENEMLMTMDDFKASESMNVDRIIPANCFGPLNSPERC